MSIPSHVPAVRVEDVPDDAVLLDVREPEEWTAGHAPAARHIPLAELPARLAEVPADQEVVVTCRAGGRSARAVAYLNASGHRAVNLDGGMQAWAERGKPMTSESGQPPAVA